MTKGESLIMKYLAKDGYKEFEGELLPNGSRALGSLVAKDRTLEDQYADALALQSEGLLVITDFTKGEVGNAKVIHAVRVELTKKGIQFIENNKVDW